MMIPREFGGSSLGLAEASVAMEEVNRCGGNAGACHGQRVHHGGSAQVWIRSTKGGVSAEDRQRRVAVAVDDGDETSAGTDITRTNTTAIRKSDRDVVNGQKVWLSRVQHSDLMILLARPSPLESVARKSDGMSIFIVHLDQVMGKGMQVRPIENMVNHQPGVL